MELILHCPIINRWLKDSSICMMDIALPVVLVVIIFTSLAVVKSAQQPPVAKRDPLLKESSGTTMASTTTNSVTSLVVARSEHGSTKEPYGSKESEAYVGFANLPTQVYRKAIKKGFEFSLMVVGVSGLGKSTLVNCLFMSDIYSSEYPGPSLRIKKTVQVETTKVVLRENGVTLTLTIIDTPGFGDCVDNSNCWQPILDYIERKYEEYLNEESRVNRSKIEDNRVHCCLYFLAPSGHRYRGLSTDWSPLGHQCFVQIEEVFSLKCKELFFGALTMSTFLPTKHNLREALLFCFNLKKSATDGHRLLCEAYGKHALSIKSCEYWFRRFKSGDFDTRDKERGGRPIKFEDAELEALLDEDSSQTQEELAETLGVTQQAISNRLKVMGMVQKQGNWVPYELKPGNIERHICTCELLLKRQNRKGHASTSTAKPNIHGKKLMLCIWWDQLRVIYYELLQPNETITGEHYQQQLMRLSRALKIKRPLYAKRHDKVIYQHDIARPHVAKVVKETLEALQWDVLPHPLYSSDYHMFRSMTHGLAEQHFTSYEEAKNWVNPLGVFLHSMKPLDIEFMKKLHDKVNIIPVIAKADTLTPEECASFKETILNELAENQIKIYEFPESPDEDENKHLKQLKPHTSCKTVSTIIKLGFEVLEHPAYSPDLALSDYFLFGLLKKELKGKRFDSDEDVQKVSKVPFAIVSSVTMIDANGKTFRGRKYPWGTVDVDNIEHSDFSALKNMLIRTHMQDLVDVTNNIRYENFRSRKLAGISTDGKPARISNKNPLAQMEEEKKEHDAKIKKMEQEMEQVFELKVREKMQKLKDSEADLQRRHEQMKKSLEHQRHELEEKRRAFEKEKMTFETQHKDVEESFKRMTMDANSKE
ncbi:SEPT7 [Cordylochernes scorpioides]|uniref:SEPT7 n=1 Tax=Cordylochernes scorpioides TaxID=51811 RepID=A0ABY6KIR1_9ARAC|nr:SEPT7 [Cordylochernes scorpioides]